MPSLRDDLLFERLAGLPFVESAHDGLIVHDAVREAIRTDLEAIDPKPVSAIAGQRGSSSIMKRSRRGSGNLWRYSADLIFLINNPAIREAFFPKRRRQVLCRTGRRRRRGGYPLDSCCTRRPRGCPDMRRLVEASADFVLRSSRRGRPDRRILLPAGS